MDGWAGTNREREGERRGEKGEGGIGCDGMCCALKLLGGCR